MCSVRPHQVTFLRKIPVVLGLAYGQSILNNLFTLRTFADPCFRRLYLRRREKHRRSVDPQATPSLKEQQPLVLALRNPYLLGYRVLCLRR